MKTCDRLVYGKGARHGPDKNVTKAEVTVPVEQDFRRVVAYVVNYALVFNGFVLHEESSQTSVYVLRNLISSSYQQS